jgi:hypothetical protein
VSAFPRPEKEQFMKEGQFDIGDIYISRPVLTEIPWDIIKEYLERHSAGDWGVMERYADFDLEAYKEKLKTKKGQLYSAYEYETGTFVSVSTDMEREKSIVCMDWEVP